MRFAVVGGISAATYVIVGMVLTDGAQWPVWQASLFAYLLCVPAAYLGQKALAFRSDSLHRVALPRYLAIQGINVSLATSLGEILSRATPVPQAGVFVATILLVSGLSFVLLDQWAFSKKVRWRIGPQAASRDNDSGSARNTQA